MPAAGGRRGPEPVTPPDWPGRLGAPPRTGISVGRAGPGRREERPGAASESIVMGTLAGPAPDGQGRQRRDWGAALRLAPKSAPKSAPNSEAGARPARRCDASRSRSRRNALPCIFTASRAPGILKPLELRVSNTPARRCDAPGPGRTRTLALRRLPGLARPAADSAESRAGLARALRARADPVRGWRLGGPSPCRRRLQQHWHRKPC